MAGVKAPVRNVQLFQLTCWPMGHKVRTAREYLGGGRQAQGMDGGISVFNEIFSGWIIAGADVYKLLGRAHEYGGAVAREGGVRSGLRSFAVSD